MRLMLIILAFILLATSGIEAQVEFESPLAYILVPAAVGVSIRGIAEDGSLNSEISLPFAVKDIGTSEWLVPNVHDFKISPNRRYLAFPAFQNGSTIAVFIYDFAEASIQQIAIPSLMTLVWSPESDAILLHLKLNDFSLPSPEIVPETFVYELDTQVMTQVTNDVNAVEYNFIWINDEQFVFMGAGIPCGDSCRAFDDIYIGSRYSLNVRALTNLGRDLPDGIPHTVCDLQWSEPIQRVYFAVGCLANETPKSSLYSVSLDGTTRLEIDFSDLYPYETAFYIREIIALKNDDAMLVALHAEELGARRWRIFRLNAEMEFSLLYEDPNPSAYQFLQTISVSPNEDLVLLLENALSADSMNGSLTLLDISNNPADVVLSRESGEVYVVCELVWRNDSSVIISQYEEGNCYPRPVPHAVLELDIASDSLSTLLENRDMGAVLLPPASNIRHIEG